jgi:hypothetical protein
MGNPTVRPSFALVVLVLLAAAFAGCNKPDPNHGLNAVERAIAETPGKVLHGRVMTDELLPLQATVELMDEPTNMTTAEDGTFLFAGLESRDYLVKVTSPGYYPEVQRAAMTLGRDFKLEFYLVKIPTGDPHHATQQFEGFISCQAVLAIDWPGWVRNDCGSADPNNQRSHNFRFDPYSSGFVVEIDWQPTSACASTLDFGMYLRLADGAIHPLAEKYVKPGERLRIPPAYFAPHLATGGEAFANIQAERCTGVGGPGLSAGLVLQQPVDVYFTAFYFEEIPTDFSIKDA